MTNPPTPSPAPASGARPSCTCATATPTYPVYRSAYHIPPCHLASREQHEAAEGARVLREEEIPAEEAKWRAKGASERTIARLIGTMKATAACLESVASAAPTPESPREAGTPCSYAGPGVCPHCFPAAPTTEGPRAEPGYLTREQRREFESKFWGELEPVEIAPAASRPGAPEGALLHANVAAIRDYFDAYCTGRPDCPVPHGAFAWMVGQLDRIATLEAAKERVAIRSTENAIAKHKAEAEVARLTEENRAIVDAFDRWQMNGSTDNRVRLGEAIATARAGSPTPKTETP